MSGPITVNDGDQFTKDPADKRVITFDFDATHLAAGVEIAGTPTVVVAGLRGDVTTTPVTVDNVSKLTGNRKVQCRLNAGALSSYWVVTCHVVTNEAPAQEFDKHVFVLLEDR